MSEHITETKDTGTGTLATCSCGWATSWRVRDGSAEAEASDHRARYDEDYRRELEDFTRRQVARWTADLRSRGCSCPLAEDSMTRTCDPACDYHGPKNRRRDSLI